jgi:two-component system chemotaxis response regulator CheB
LEQIPNEYRSHILVGTGSKEGLFTLDRSLRERCSFDHGSLGDNTMLASRMDLDLIICRNVLIYFEPSRCEQIIHYFVQGLKPDGLLVLGHSEAGLIRDGELRALGHSCFIKDKAAALRARTAAKASKKILVVDDLAVARVTTRSMLQKHGFTVVEAGSAEEATDIIGRESFDLISLDLGLPGESGASWLKRMRAQGLKTPIIIVSASDPTAVEAESLFGALEKGAQEFITKEVVAQNFNRFIEVIEALTTEKDLKPELPQKASPEPRKNVLSIRARTLEKSIKPELILVGASTGGPDAIWKLLGRFPQPCPPILIVQHTNPFFASHFALTVARTSGLTLAGAQAGDELKPSSIYIAQGDYHIQVERKGDKLVLGHSNVEKQNGHRPSVDHLFKSVADLKVPSVAILLTGMGRDGASGMKALFQSEVVFNMAQDAESSVVFGMPKEAIEMGATHFIGNIAQIRTRLEMLLQQSPYKAVGSG